MYKNNCLILSIQVETVKEHIKHALEYNIVYIILIEGLINENFE